VLAQIIFDEESRGQNLLPIQFLRQLIRFYGDSMQAFVPSYLEMSLDGFTKQQERLRSQFAGAIPVPPGMNLLEEQVRQNLALFDRAMKMFTPFAFVQPDAVSAAPAETAKSAGDTSLDDLKKRIEEMQEQIAKLAAKE
jgi:polyhydroxyalkanoate synthesis regulator protein